MKKILLIEDESTKLAAIVNEISTYELSNLSIEHAVSLTDAIQSIYRNTYDLIIFDMFLPMVTGDQIVNSTDTLIHTLNSLENFQGQSILITQYDIDSTDTFKFNAAGIVVVKYSTFDDKWKKSLGCQISKIIDSPRYDFLIFLFTTNPVTSCLEFQNKTRVLLRFTLNPLLSITAYNSDISSSLFSKKSLLLVEKVKSSA